MIFLATIGGLFMDFRAESALLEEDTP